MGDALGFRPFHPKQQEGFDLLFRDTGDLINVFNLVAGRGSGKTILAAAILLEMCLGYNKGQRHAWTAPTYGMIDRFIVPTWRACVPEFINGRRLWTYYKSSDQKRIEFTPEFGGAIIMLLSREKFDRIRGTQLAGVVHDEIGMDKTREAWDITMLCLRGMPGLPQPKLFCVGISTPRRGWWQSEVEQNPWIKWTSYDNPWAPKEQVEQMEAALGAKFARQELHADFISLTGAIWDGFVDSTRDGNRLEGGWHGSDYILACDIGIHSGWLLIQERGANDVIVEEYTPDNEGAQQTLKRIKAKSGTPYKIIVGSDVKTRWEGDASLTPLIPFRDAFGSVPVISPLGYQQDKSLQYMVTSARICNDAGSRRLMVAENLVSNDPDGARGILDMLKNDEWPAVPKVGEQLPKDKRYEHIRDALLYYCVVQHPPSFVQGGLG